MQILSVALKNFKSHSDREFQFQVGTNAICGENGAGKSSILEAIAWTLFNHTGAYTKEDLIRNGASSAQVTVRFVSDRDGRTYEVQRCTTKGYALYDPQLNVKLDYKLINEEVMPWLRQQFNVAPGTDLARLFANTIGVPQGTFTAAFLETTENRRKVFDSILKVEEYKSLHRDLKPLEDLAKAEVEQLERKITECEEALQDWEAVKLRRSTVHAEITQNQVNLAQLQTKLTQLQTEKDRLATQAQLVQQLQANVQKAIAQAEGKRQANQVLRQSVDRAQQAVAICTAKRSSYQAFGQAEAALKSLDQQIKQRQQLQKSRDAQQQALRDRQSELTKLSLQLDRLAEAEIEIEALQPQIDRQQELEQKQQAATEELQQLQAFQREQQTAAKQFGKIQKDLDRLSKEISRIEQLEAQVEQLPNLEQQRDRLQAKITRVEAARQFESELRGLFTSASKQRDRQADAASQAAATLWELRKQFPQAGSAFDTVMTTLQSEVKLNNTLLESLQGILTDLNQQTAIDQLQIQLQTTKRQIETAQKQQAEVATLTARQEQENDLRDQAIALDKRLQELKAALTKESYWQEQRSLLSTALGQLNDPRGRSQLLGQQIEQRFQLQQNFDRVEQTFEPMQAAIESIELQLAPFAALDEQIEAQQAIRQQHQSDYLIYLEHQKDANSLGELEAQMQEAIAWLQILELQQRELEQQYAEQNLQYDPQQWQQVETEWGEVRSQADRLVGSLPQQQALLAELDTQLSRLQLVAEGRDRARSDLKQREQVRKFIAFARKAYKDAGPRITERYVQSISREADKLFRELMNRPNIALEWTRDYEIILQEGAHTRRFVNLSGGEQMCAALAVRLALLRVLADLDVAFFDEPTTNMDRPRRDSLAEAIANIKTFRQIFVISHDDTFEKVTENVILVTREV